MTFPPSTNEETEGQEQKASNPPQATASKWLHRELQLVHLTPTLSLLQSHHLLPHLQWKENLF